MLLYALSGIRSFYPVPFELVAIAVDLGYEDFDLSPVKSVSYTHLDVYKRQLYVFCETDS